MTARVNLFRYPIAMRGLALAADGVAFLVLCYLVIRAVLLAQDGVLAPSHAGALAAAGAVALIALCLVGRRPSTADERSATIKELVATAVLLGFLPLIATKDPHKGQSFLWLAQEWSRVPENLVLLAWLSPGWVLLDALLLVVVVAGIATTRRVVAVVPLAIAVAVVFLVADFTADVRISVYLVIYAGPWFACAVAAALGSRRFAARFAVAASVTLCMVVPYAGLVPLGHARFEDEPGVRRLYPVGESLPEFPLTFLRSFQIDHDRNRLYTSYGPTSGLLSFDLDDGSMTQEPTINGLVRHLWTEDGRDRLFAVDWVLCDLLEIDKETLEIVERHDIWGGERISPMSFLIDEGRIFVVFSEWPVLAEFDPETLEQRRSMSFRDTGFTDFRSGAWNAVADLDADRLWVELGAVDARGSYLLARVDLESFTVEGTAEVPDGGLAILRVPERKAILTAGFFTDRIFEFDEDTLELRRVIRGPLNVRALAYDAKRDLLLASGFLSGELWALHWSDASVARRTRVGNKSMSLLLDDQEDRLFVGSRDGIFEVDLATWLAEAGA